MRRRSGFAWSQGGQEGNEEIVTVLEIPPVIGPATAVRAAMMEKKNPESEVVRDKTGAREVSQ